MEATQVEAAAGDGHTLADQAARLLAGACSGALTDAARGADHPVPRQLATRRQTGEEHADQACAAPEPRLGRDLSVGRDPSLRDRVDDREDALAPKIVELHAGTVLGHLRIGYPAVMVGPRREGSEREEDRVPETERPSSANPDYESTPLSRQEYISAIVHLYRGELYRANSGRIRLDNTTNWAVLTVAGLLTFSFREGGSSHWILLIGMALVTVFLAFEARRFRMADLWRARVRKIEENFYGPILRRDLQSPEVAWGRLVADDLFRPHYKISRLIAMRVRFSRNYWPIFLVLLLAWVVHVLGVPDQADTWVKVRDHLATGLLPWWAPLAYLGVVLAGVLGLYLTGPLPRDEIEHWEQRGGDDEEEPLFDL